MSFSNAKFAIIFISVYAILFLLITKMTYEKLSHADCLKICNFIQGFSQIKLVHNKTLIKQIFTTLAFLIKKKPKFAY